MNACCGGGFVSLSIALGERLRLHCKIAVPTGEAVFIRPPINDRRGGEVAMRRWRGGGPFKGCRLPGIVVDFLAPFNAPEEIDNERNLSQAHHPGGNRDRRVPLESTQAPDLFAGESPALPAIIPPTVHAEHSLQEHRKKNNIHADKRRPKMHLSPELAHSSSGCFRK